MWVGIWCGIVACPCFRPLKGRLGFAQRQARVSSKASKGLAKGRQGFDQRQARVCTKARVGLVKATCGFAAVNE